MRKAPVTDPVIAGAAVPARRPAPGAPADYSSQAKLTIRIDAGLLGRVRAAFLAEGPQSGVSSMSGWLAGIIEDAVLEVEQRLNDGRPFTPVGVDVVPKGRLGGLS